MTTYSQQPEKVSSVVPVGKMLRTSLSSGRNSGKMAGQQLSNGLIPIKSIFR